MVSLDVFGDFSLFLAFFALFFPPPVPTNQFQSAFAIVPQPVLMRAPQYFFFIIDDNTRGYNSNNNKEMSRGHTLKKAPVPFFAFCGTVFFLQQQSQQMEKRGRKKKSIPFYFILGKCNHKMTMATSEEKVSSFRHQHDPLFFSSFLEKMETTE